MANRMGKSGNSDILFSSALKSLRMVTIAMKLKDAWMLLERKAMENLDSVLKSRDITLSYSQSYSFSSSHVWMLELDHNSQSYTLRPWLLRVGWTPKNCCFVVLEKTLESPLDCKENKPVNPKGNQPWLFIGRTVAEAEAPILWPPDAGKDWKQKKKGAAEDEMVR